MASAKEKSATPRGKFSHLKRGGDFLFLSGISARRPDNTFAGARANNHGCADLDGREQTHAVIGNIAAILATEGATLDALEEVTTFLANMNDFKGCNEEYGKYSPTTAQHAPPLQWISCRTGLS